MKLLIILILLTYNVLSLDFDKAIEQVKKHENFKAKMYRDNGHYSIGYGTNLSYLTEPEALMLLTHRLAMRLSRLQNYSWFRAQNKARQQVLLNMSYQIGHIGLLKFKGMIRQLKRKNYAKAADEMKDSLWYKQSGSRSRELVRAMRKG